jgi:hypothetical protein
LGQGRVGGWHRQLLWCGVLPLCAVDSDLAELQMARAAGEQQVAVGSVDLPLEVGGARCPVAWLRTCRRRVARVAVSSVNSPSAMVTASMVWPNGIVSIVAPLSRSRSYSPSGGNSAPQPKPEAMMLVDRTSPT